MQRSGPRAEVVADILRELPEWFGIEESTLAYIDATHHLPTYVAVDRDGPDAAGVLLLRHHFTTTAEVYLIAVRRHLHRHGVGRALIEHVVADLRGDGTRLLTVKTLGPSRPDPGYARTRSFYEGMGFVPVEEFHDLWADNTCLLLVKSLT